MDWLSEEDEWLRVAPRLAEIISSWDDIGYIEVYRANEWPAHQTGRRIKGAELQALLREDFTWKYEEIPREAISLLATKLSRELSVPPDQRN
ncbi:hypothetical protein [Streptomyces sp. H27-D2]|uniref:hypothetical protein n=1 Tax=Streptomyces sp. H27-D2 TaxID=3046304 RepID=UPI002DBEA652|nr:hypothetical protein [Streptomyces sp. H27-D2]MEC4014880.1 hypothetical protein [Streptomyces sp. H27-D2]